MRKVAKWLSILESSSLVLSACASEPVADPPPPKLVCEVGGASDLGEGFVPWTAPGQDTSIITGIQGGQHIWVSVRAQLPASQVLDVEVTMYREATGTDAEVWVKPGTVEYKRKTAADGPWQLAAGLFAFVKEPCNIKGHRVRVETKATDLDGKVGTAKAWITPRYDGPCFN